MPRIPVARILVPALVLALCLAGRFLLPGVDAATLPAVPAAAAAQAGRPKILFVITDDQSWRDTGAAGSKWVHTPPFDRVARDGVYDVRADLDQVNNFAAGREAHKPQ